MFRNFGWKIVLQKNRVTVLLFILNKIALKVSKELSERFSAIPKKSWGTDFDCTEGKCLISMNSVTRCSNKSSPNSPQSCLKRGHRSVKLKVMLFQKIAEYFGYFRRKQPFKNSPIWHHCQGRKIFDKYFVS